MPSTAMVAARRTRTASSGFHREFASGPLAGSRVFLDLEADLLPFIQGREVGHLDCGGMDEHILPAVVRAMKPKPLVGLYHLIVPVAILRPPLALAAGEIPDRPVGSDGIGFWTSVRVQRAAALRKEIDTPQVGIRQAFRNPGVSVFLTSAVRIAVSMVGRTPDVSLRTQP